MTRALLLSATIALLALAACSPQKIATKPTAKPRYELISIGKLPISGKQFVDSFAIETWGVYPVAVCHIPSGWLIGSDNDGTPGGKLHGQSGHGASGVSDENRNWDQFEGMFLVAMPGGVEEAHPPVPATFALKAQINDYGPNDTGREMTFDNRYIHRVPADRCPEPRP